MKRYWLFITNIENWKLIKKQSIYGFNKKEDYCRVNKGDLAIIYVISKRIGGSFEIVEKLKEKKIKFYNKPYNFQILLEKGRLYEEPLELNYITINEISIFKGKIRWGTVLMGRSLVEISKKDFNLFRRFIEDGCG